ncbi:MAG: hypothetical protein P8Y70_19305 [Candidatus Lokiarchaeota archaeon]
MCRAKCINCQSFFTLPVAKINQLIDSYGVILCENCEIIFLNQKLHGGK